MQQKLTKLSDAEFTRRSAAEEEEAFAIARAQPSPPPPLLKDSGTADDLAAGAGEPQSLESEGVLCLTRLSVMALLPCGHRSFPPLSPPTSHPPLVTLSILCV